MKMPRTQCEAGNVQFVQELAEVDGPFEAPININFRDLTKLELPALIWNRSDACPRKMKITNTGHTVIVSAKWKCERPYLTGGPLVGKYVFSQIHFHWGQTDCRGSEHQICGEQFPLEMHVAHFKTEYMTQESALREKDGMVVVVYLFKLQEEPNHSLKKIINSLPRVKQPSTSYAIDPRPIVSLCHPFTEDYFMYWGSVVTSTCAHILLWIICREPFGISKEQVNEFRKIMDSSQQPICKNSREVQPLHKRNVFHVNASKHLDAPLLPIKKRLECYCKESKDAFNISNSCHCQGAFQNQEDVEGNFPEHADPEGMQTEQGWFANQTFVVQTATMQSLSIALKRPGSDPVKNQCSLDNLKKAKSGVYNQQIKLVSKSCCFFPTLETKKISNLNEKREIREKTKLFHSAKAFSQVMQSLETLKNQTFKKLKKIESINQEIKDMKPFCQDPEDKRWIQKIEKTITRQKRFTIKSSQGCLKELKKLAKDCNFEKYFDSKAFPAGSNSRKMVWLNNKEMATTELPCSDTLIEDERIHRIENQPSKHFDVAETIRFSSEAQKLIQSFFEDIKDSDEVQETIVKDPSFKKIKSLCSMVGDSKSVSTKSKGYITQKMFNLGNLGNRFFTEIITEDVNLDENWNYEVRNGELLTALDVNEAKSVLDRCESEKLTETNIESKSKNEDIIPLHRVNIPILPPKTKERENKALETFMREDASFKNKENQKFSLKKTYKKIYLKKSANDSEEKFYEMADEKLMRTHETKIIPSKSQSSSLNLSTDSMDTQRLITKKVRKPKKGFSEQKGRKLFVLKIPSKKLHNKTSCKKLEGNRTQKRNLKNKEKKNAKDENAKYKSLSGLNSTSKEEVKDIFNKPTQEEIKKTKLKLEVEKKNISKKEFTTEGALMSPERKKLTARSSKEGILINVNKNINLTTTETRTIITDPTTKHQKSEFAKIKQENFKEERMQKLLKESFSEERQSIITFESAKNELKTISKTFTSRTYRASSVDSKTSYSRTGTIKESENDQSYFGLKNTALKKETPKLSEEKPLLKTNCRSLTNISTRPKADFIQRLQLESIDSRKKTNQDTFDKKLKESYIIVKQLPRKASNETHKNLNEEQEQRRTNQALQSQEKCSTSQNTLEYDIEFSNENSSQVNGEVPLKVQVLGENEKNLTLKPAERKNQFLEKESEEPFEISHMADSDKSFARNTSKGDAEFSASDNKNFQTSVSCSTLKKDSTNRHHSAETLHSHKKTQKRKGKKRPHCSKRNSRHYIRKNYSMFKKPSKPFNFLSLTDEEQLKIISVNVAKYIKQKLMDEKSQVETKNSSSTKAEKELRDLNISEKKSEEVPMQASPTANPQKAKKLRIPVLKSIEKTKEKKKDLKNTKEPNVVESQIETIKQKPQLHSSSKPVNNFIKLNKQMAGTYKRIPPAALETIKSKEREKSILGIKPKAKTQKKSKEKFPAQKPKEESNLRPRTLLPPITQIPSPKGIVRKEKQMKGPSTYRKHDSNTKATNKAQASSSKVEKPKEGIGVTCKPDLGKTFPPPEANPKETPQAKKCSVPICTLNSNSAASETAENLNGRNFQHEMIKSNTKGDLEKEIKSEALFKKELEYFITMQMYLNNEISKDIEDPLHYFSPSSDSNVAESPFTNCALLNLDFCSRDEVVAKKKLEECSSSYSELSELPEKFNLEKDSTALENEDNSKSKQILTVKAPKEFQDSTRINSTPVREVSEDSPSDSSYDCKISITLNTNLSAKEVEVENERQGYDTYCLEENCNSQTTTSLEGSSSHLTDVKAENKKKESEIYLEMKQKLLEILEGEIKREIGISCAISSGNSSDGFGFRAGDSEGNLRSRSTGSSSDNIESLAQISNTMRQYLTYLRELRRLSDESKDYEDF